jgi:hypothetical protein
MRQCDVLEAAVIVPGLLRARDVPPAEQPALAEVIAARFPDITADAQPRAGPLQTAYPTGPARRAGNANTVLYATEKRTGLLRGRSGVSQ